MIYITRAIKVYWQKERRKVLIFFKFQNAIQNHLKKHMLHKSNPYWWRLCVESVLLNIHLGKVINLRQVHFIRSANTYWMPSLCKIMCAVGKYRDKYDMSFIVELQNQSIDEEIETPAFLYSFTPCVSLLRLPENSTPDWLWQSPQKLVFSEVCPKVQDQVVSRVGFFWGPPGL